MKNSIRVLAVMNILLIGGVVHAGSFLIKKKTTADETSGAWSRTKLQEEIGSQVKEVFTTTIAMTQELGTLQVCVATAKQTTETMSLVLQKNGQILQELSSLQRLCSRVLEGLVDDNIIFKKSHKKELEAMHERIQVCSVSLKKQHQAVKSYALSSASVSTLAVASDDVPLATQLTTCLAELTKQTTTLTNDRCVKKL